MVSLGGIGIIHSNNTPSEQFSLVHSAKSRRFPFVSDFDIKSPWDAIESESDFGCSSVILVTLSGSWGSRLVGYVLKSDWVKVGNKEGLVCDYMIKLDFSVSNSYDLDQIAGFLGEKGIKLVPTVRESDVEVLDVVTMDDVERIRELPKRGLPSLGHNADFLVGASLGTVAVVENF